MTKPSVLFHVVLFWVAFILVGNALADDKWQTLETKHYRVIFQKRNEQMAEEIVQVAEKVWPTLAKAYDVYDRYQRIDILLSDDGDDANGNAVYTFSRVVILAPHMDWILRNRRNWIGNVVTHELSHVFSLRRAAWLSPVDEVDVYGSTYNYRDQINYSLSIPWVPLVAPTWYVEGIAQFEAEQNGQDKWDSQRDMLLRDAYLTGTLPSLAYIETFDSDEDWTQGERVYNTGFAFLNYLKDRYGLDKVRKLAWPKPIFNFSTSVEKAFGKPLPDLYEDFKKSLAEKYAEYKDLPQGVKADPALEGNYQQNLAFSSDGRYMAWLGNDNGRRAPLNWVFWKDLQAGGSSQSSKPSDQNIPNQAPEKKTPQPGPPGMTANPTTFSDLPGFHFPRPGNPILAMGQNKGLPLLRSLRSSAPPFQEPLPTHGGEHSEEPGSAGLEFNHANTLLLTTRPDYYENEQYTDIWEYDFRSKAYFEEAHWHRLTWEERASYPTYHPTRNLIAYSRKRGGSTNLAVLDSAGRIRQLTNFTRGEQVYSPRFTPGGDSIAFTLGIVNQEAIVSLPLNSASYDALSTFKDSTDFPDSLTLAKNQKLTFLTSFQPSEFRDLRYAHDTLFWSSNFHDSAYNVYAKVPRDSNVYRCTNVATQALEPLPHDGQLYYQGFTRQEFQIYRKPLALVKTDIVLGPTSIDTLPSKKSKPKSHDSFEQPGLETGEYNGDKVAFSINPFLEVSPQFIGSTTSLTYLSLGLGLQFGNPYSDAWSQSIAGAISKQTDFNTPLNYWFSYSGSISSQPIRHTRFTWPVDLYYSWYHDIIQDQSRFNLSGGFRQATDSIFAMNKVGINDLFTRDIVNLAMPLPANFMLGGEFLRQTLTENVTQDLSQTFVAKDSVVHFPTQKSTSFQDAQEHRHFNAGLFWNWSKGMLGTYLPTGVGISLDARKWWATYEVGADSLGQNLRATLSQQGRPNADNVFVQGQFDPWSADMAVSGVLSKGKDFSLFVNGEAGAFLNKFPMDRSAAEVDGRDTIYRDNPANGLWPLPYRLGYYRMRGYPYSFVYNGHDIMQGTSLFLGQYGIQIPLPFGVFLDGLPTSSLKQFTLTGIGEAGTVLNRSPDRIIPSFQRGEHNLLMDFGARFSMNFHLYHEYPFSFYVEGFVPYNQLQASNLLWNDYPHTGPANADGSPSPIQLANAPADRDLYMKRVQDPRFFVGLTLGFL